MYNALQEGVLVRAPRKLREDWRRLGIAANCARFMEAFGIAPDSAAKAHAAFCQTLALLEDDREVPAIFPLFFRAKMAFEQGYALDTTRCSRCGAALADQARAGFSVRGGGFFCMSCARQEKAGSLLVVGHEMLDALTYVQEYAPSCWSGNAMTPLSPQGQRECAQVVDAFMEHHVGIRWQGTRFTRI